MNDEELSEKEIEEVVNSFKSYLKLVAKHSAIDYFRKQKVQGIKEISLNKLTENTLVVNDEMLFFTSLEDSDDIFSNLTYLKAFKKLNKKEQKVLWLYSKNYSALQISNILEISKNNVNVIKFRAIRKFKRIINEDDM